MNVTQTSCLGYMYSAVRKKLAAQLVSRRLFWAMYFQLVHSMPSHNMGLQKCQLTPSRVVQCGNAAKRGGSTSHPYRQIQRLMTALTELQVLYGGEGEAAAVCWTVDMTVGRFEAYVFWKGSRYCDLTVSGCHWGDARGTKAQTRKNPKQAPKRNCASSAHTCWR
jgi:hypothetical protein